ncbi:uncharacterized protein LOC131950489 [Physella acuta]|uniref:uncharacterized protein LOC131950489 n=1 Tax=Physella acuta TaxID=109671 RepID=UPI0027DC452E|nr:uncharacterized protein LOC131950489 [Physella acuta]
MDEDSDVDKDMDNSLVDLHLGLDSSYDENGGDTLRNDTLTDEDAANLAGDKETLADEQLIMLQDMVLEMKKSFQAALQELGKIQDKEEGEASNSKQLQQQQQKQLDDLTASIHYIKDQLSSLAQNVEQIQVQQRVIQDELEVVKSTRASSQDTKSRSDSERRELLEDLPAPPEEWNNKLSDLSSPDEYNITDAVPNDNDVTAVACKSLSLTQALGEKCLKLNQAVSSDDDVDLAVTSRRVSHYTPKSGLLVGDDAASRRHSMPGSTPQSRQRDVVNAAKRQKAVQELADSERDYCSKLWSLLHTYFTPLQSGGFFSNRELDVLFPPYLEQLYAEHCHICTGLQERLVHWTYMGTIADLLARVTDSYSADSFLQLYQEYAEDLPTAVTCLRRALIQSAEFKDFLKAIKHSSCQSEELMSLIMAPVQHVPRFLLQLQQVVRHTPPAHPDYPLLQTSLQRLRGFVDQLNKDVSSAMQTLSQDHILRVNIDSGQMLSTRDSGVHSNSTEEDNITSARAFSKTDHSQVLPEWLDRPYGSHLHQSDDFGRHDLVRPLTTRQSALSQPDLTTMNGFSPESQLASYLPRSQSTLPTNGSEGILRERSYKHFKVKKRHLSPAGRTQSQDYLLGSHSPRMRPSSAIDFITHSQQQQQYLHHRELQQRPYQYPGPLPRPHSAFGPNALEAQHRPTIISRKHLRRSQPLISGNKSFWPESAMQSRTGHARGPLSAHDLLPTRPSMYPSSALIDDADDEEDDTRTSDTHSLGTSGSHQHSSSRCSNDGQDLDLDIIQASFDSHGLRIHRHSQDINRPVEFSAADVTASLAKKLYTSNQGNGMLKPIPLGENLPQDVPKPLSPLDEDPSSSSQLMVSSNSTTCDLLVMNEQVTQPDQSGVVVHNTPEILAAISDVTNTDGNCNVVQMAAKPQESNLSGPKVFQIDKAKINFVQPSSSDATRNEKEVVSQQDSRHEGQDLSEKNRQFLLSLASVAPGENSARNSMRKSASDVNTNPETNRNSPSIKTAPLPPPRTTKTLSGFLESSVHLNGTGTPKSSVAPSSYAANRLSQPLPLRLSKTDSSSTAADAPKVSPANKYQRAISHSATVHGLSQPKSPVYSQDSVTRSISTFSAPADNSHFNSRNNPFFSSSNLAAHTKMPGDSGHSEAKQSQNSDRIDTYTDKNDFPVYYDDGKRDERKKSKDGGRFNPSHDLPKASDDPVGARKKMHLKASIKNLFTKKKGRVILADVEREVVMEMAAAATTAASTTTLSTMTASSSPPANMPRNLKGNDGCPKDDVTDGLAFEIKTRRDQGNSTYSPVKVSKLFHRQMKNKARQVSHSKDCRELSSEEFQHFQDSLEKSSTSGMEIKPVDHSNKNGEHSTSNSNGLASAASLDILNTSNQKSFLEKNGRGTHSPGVENKEIDKKLETRSGNVVNNCRSDLSKVNISMKENERFLTNSQPLFKQVMSKSENDSFSNGSLEESSTLFVRKFMKDKLCHHRHSVGEPNQHPPHTTKPLALCYKCQMCRKETLKSGCASDSEVAVGLRTSLDLGNWRVVGCRCGELCKEECEGEVVLSKGESQHKAILQNLDDDQKKALLTEKVIPCPNTDPDGYNVLDSLKPCSDAIFLFESNSKKSSPSSPADGNKKLDKQSQLRGSLMNFDQNHPYKQQHNFISHKKNCKKSMKSSPPTDHHSSSSQVNKSYNDVLKTHANSENKLSKSFLKLFPSASNKRPDPNQASDQSKYDGKQTASSPSSQILNISQTSCSSDQSSDSCKDKNKSFTSWDNSGILYTGENFDMPVRKEKTKANRFFIKPRNQIVLENKDMDKMASASPAYVLEDKDFEHRYRLYYDDEAKVSLNLKRSEPERGNCLLSMRTPSCDSVDGNQPYLMMQPNMAVITLSSKDDSDKRRQFPQSNTVAQCFISGVGSKPSQASGDRGHLNSFGTHFGEAKSGFLKSGAQSGQAMFTGAQSENKSRDNCERNIPECTRRNDFRQQSVSSPSPCDVQNLTSSYVNSQGNSPTNSASQGRVSSTAMKLDSLKHQETSVKCPASSSSCNDGAYDESSSYKPKKSYMPGCNVGSSSGETQLKATSLEGERSQKNMTTFHQVQPNQLTSKNTQSTEISCTPMLNIHKNCNFPTVNGHSFNGQQMRPGSYPSRTSNDMLAEPARHKDPRTSSPMDFFSILPYNDYTLANKSSDSGTLVPSESDSQGTLKNEQVVLRAAPEKRSRNKVLVNINKPRKADCRESPTSTTIIETFNGAEPYPNKHSRKSKQDGVILRTPDHKTFQPQCTRNEDEAAVGGTFDPAYVPYFPSRPLSHPHVDNNHRHHGRKESRHMSYHEHIRKSPNPLGIDSTFIPGSHRRSELHPARNSCDASSTRQSPSSISLSSNGCRYGNSPSCSESPHDQVPHPTPDLLPLTTSKESPPSASKEPSVKKVLNKELAVRLIKKFNEHIVKVQIKRSSEDLVKRQINKSNEDLA